MRTLLRSFSFSIFATLAVLVWVAFGLGLGALWTTMVLIAIEVAFSFDNAIVNAKILEKLSHFWQQLFLTLGMVVAILGLRLVFPILIVSVGAHLPWRHVVDLALHHPDLYASHLEAAHPAIAAFGGGFLLTLALYFFFDGEREVLWHYRIERLLQRAGSKWWIAPALTFVIVYVCSMLPLNHYRATTLQGGALGIAIYTVIKLFIDWVGRLGGQPKKGKIIGASAVIAVLYLELLDASFSFDGVLGAFAITTKVTLIAIGLGIGALWVRSLTVFMVRRGILSTYKYLEHGAHYAILVLALALLVSVFWNVPEAITGVVGLGLILASLIASHQAIEKI
ncbi:MAG TPA: DUF475 domain-containing protein [Candidatus Saccharimonadales bacterium]|nr:DUF475 domain-containing protein [Candidatus Saccharimonadales bacterium]HSX46747.1 DUF475 domain-containing protein [Patescibacteria group bacterium]